VTGQDGSSARLVELSGARREQAMDRWALLRPHIEDGVALTEIARQDGVPLRTAQRWLAHYREYGLVGWPAGPAPAKGNGRCPSSW
jgi:putative transposase